MSVRKRINTLYNRIDAAKCLFEIFGGSQEMIEECENILLEINSIPKLVKNPEKAQIRLQEIIKRSEIILSEITRNNWDKYKEHLKDKEKEKEYLRKLEVIKQEEIVDSINIISKLDNT